MEEEIRVNPPGLSYKNWVWLVVLGIFILVVALSTFYTVGPDEVGIIKRFGKYMRATDPGLHVKIPFAESVTKVKIKYIFKEEFGFRTLKPGIKTLYAPEKWQEESLMLTGDLNVAEVEWIVQYKITDPYKYLFKIRNPTKTLRDISEVVMRLVVGDRSVDEILTVGRMEAATEAQRKLQKILDSYESGIKIVTLKLAEGYGIKRVNQAEGDADKFLAVWQEYKKAPDVTRKRLYLEALTQVLPRVGKIYVVDTEQKTILPFLSLKGGEK